MFNLLTITYYLEIPTGGAVPALAQLSASAYHAAVSSSSKTPSQDDKMHKSRTSTL